MRKFYLLMCFVLLSSTAFAQIKVSGRVTDESGVPLPGTTVLEKGTTTGTVTDADGSYTIDVSGADAILTFSFIGFTSIDIAVSGRNTVDVSLQPSATGLDEVVVVGYGTQRKKDFTGSLASANLKAFEQAPNTNILQSLSGAVPGINIGQVSTAGQEPTIQIRGRSSLSGNLNPLIVLDGVIYRGRLSDLNPKDIESIDVLKDVSSKAVYGAQAANGILLVTSKKSKKGQKPIISYSGFYSTQTPSNQLNPLRRDGYLKKARDVDYQNGYLAPDFLQENPAWTVENNVPFFAPVAAGLANGTDYDWFGEATDPGYISDHVVSFRGATENTSYYFSGGYTKQQGWILNDNYDRKSIRINVETKINDWLSIGTNTFGSFSDLSGESPTLFTLSSISPLSTPRDANGELITNPLGNIEVNPFLNSASDDKDLVNNISGLFYGIFTIPKIEGLSYRVNFSNNYRWNLHANSNRYGAGFSGSAYKNNNSTYDRLLDNIITYEKRIDENHGISATILAGRNKVSYEGTRAEGTGFSNLDLSYNSIQQAAIQRVTTEAYEESFSYQMARVNYDYKYKYLLTATIRRDGFSGFAKNNQIGVFPSIGLGWVLSEEKFLNNSSVVNFLKIRGSYGLNGNLTGRYSSLARVTAPDASKYVFGDGGATVNGFTVASLSNPNLTWEKSKGLNMGVDIEVLSNRVSATIDLYQTTTTDLLYNLVLPEITGFSSITSNIGEISNKGIELILNTVPIKTGAFTWNLDFNFDANRNKIKKLLGVDADGDGKEDDLTANGLFINESIGSIYSYQIDGIYQISDVGNIPAGYAPGMYKLANLGGDESITPADDRRILGRSEPAYSFGIRNSFSFKGFTFQVFIKSIQGGKNSYLGKNDPFGAYPYDTPGNAQNNNWFSEIDYWSPSNPNATYSRPGIVGPLPASRYFDRSFIRLQDISLTYDLTNLLNKKFGVGSARVFVSGKNLITLTDWEGWDPETGQGLAVTGTPLPVMKGVSFGIDLSF